MCACINVLVLTMGCGTCICKCCGIVCERECMCLVKVTGMARQLDLMSFIIEGVKHGVDADLPMMGSGP